MEAPMIFELRRPKNVVPDKKYPALFVMHGIGSNEQNMLSLVEGLEESFYIFSIRGHISQGPGFAFFTIEGYGKPHRDVFDDGIQRLTNTIDYACEEYPLDLSKLYLLGFSQGAILSMTLALTLGSKIKGIVALSGYIPMFVKEEYTINPGNDLAAFISHGEYDQVLPFEWGKENVEYFTKLGIPVTFKTYPEGHSVSLTNFQDFRKWIENDLQR
ncbi:alpha/beta hydrolase [Bacillus sp. EB600]|uniref:alpha/beta hydrolase n=1 Tax=Bacillus sp. EB600 TaxID=2806345 RepID=UPI0021088E4A|nr:dienelactone hydrolase family protein [Bacillus sp. EB600]MCQ6282012.1 dienelactone hydrolase family protein [Bacillus sp. EB600]